MAPEDKMISISFALTRDLLDRIDDRRHQEGVGRSELLRGYSELGLSRKPRPRKAGRETHACRPVPIPQ
jgi:metal-responsive CopG/Arc/MetJ family transcriptional regulator